MVMESEELPLSPGVLENTNLTKSEVEVYLALIRTGSTKIGELTKEVGLHRSRVYEAVNKLSDKGLVSYVIVKNVKFFEASDPNNLVLYIEEEKEKLEEKKKKIKKIIPELEKMPSARRHRSEAHVFAGKDGFKAVRRDILRQGEDIYLIGGVGKEDRFLKYFFPGFNRERIKNNIKWRVLYDHEVKGKNISRLKLMEVKFLPKEFSTPAIINIYADRVVNVLWDGDNPTCFMIINRKIADSYVKWFNLLWKYSE